MKYVVKIPNTTTGYISEWKVDSEHNSYDKAKNRCLEILGTNNYYAEPDLVNDFKECYFSKNKQNDLGWDCKITIIK